MKGASVLLGALIALIALSGPAQGALIDRGGGLIYDTDLGITWLQDANYAKTSGDDADGGMEWSQAMTWVAGLVYQGYSDWRLPATPPCSGYYCTSSEMGHLDITELGNPIGPMTNVGPFTNIQTSSYWTSAQPSDVTYAYQFTFQDWAYRYQTADPVENFYFAWAVRDGDVTAVSEPSPMLLFGAASLGIALARRKFKTWQSRTRVPRQS